MRHLLTDPAFPDIVGESAGEPEGEPSASANDNHREDDSGLSDPLITMIGKLEIARTRLW